MSEPPKMRSPRMGIAEAKEKQTNSGGFFLPDRNYPVNRPCSDCQYFREKVGIKGRCHCAITGEGIRPTATCHVDPGVRI